MFFYIIRFVLFINPKATVSELLLNVSSSLDIKNRNRIGDRGNPYKIPKVVGIVSLLYSLNTILVLCPIKKN